MLIDNVIINVKAGDGGNGKVSFLSNGQKAKGGPDGGNGGNGGDIYFVGSTNINDLKEFRYKKNILGENGIGGGRNNLYGKNAQHKTVLLPLGTQITDLSTNQTFEITDSPILVAKGGNGGLGNNEFKTATNRAPKFAQSGERGEERELRLELKLIADVGFVGFPNAGKSSLLAVYTNANPKIGNYPFTTLEPNIGVLEHITLADIPGLIEGASAGKGLGIGFLKHIEKTKLIVHCIDATEENSLKSYETIRNEFGNFSKELLNKPEIIFLTKKDLISEKELAKKIKELKKTKRIIIPISIYDTERLEEGKKEILKNVI